MSSPSTLERLKRGLIKTRLGFADRLQGLFQSRRLDEQTLGAIEEILLSADVGVQATQRLVDAVRRRYPAAGGGENGDPFSFLRGQILAILTPSNPTAAPLEPVDSPRVIVFLGVNGVGKTTTIGKMASQFRREGKKVLLIAADTFRAAAIEQLEAWGARAGAEVIKHQAGADPSAVAFDGIRAAAKRKSEIVLVDTAGRLHTKVHLVEELKKMRRVIAREQPGAPHETLLVLDATTGQNAVQQARIFKEALDVDGIVLSKLDGTAKGGIIVAIREELGIPVRHIGVGEDVDDLQRFDAEAFVRSLFAERG